MAKHRKHARKSGKPVSQRSALLREFVGRSGLTRKSPLFFERRHLEKGLLHLWETIAREHAGRYSTKQSAIQVYGAILGMVPFAADSRVVSIGSGNGVFESFIAKHVCPKGEVIGIDFSQGMNEIANNLAKREGIQNTRFLLGQSEQIPLPSHLQGIVLSLDQIHFSKDWRKAVSELARVVSKAPSSRIVLMFKLDASIENIPEAGIKAEISSNGLEVVSSRTFEFRDKIDKETAVKLAKAGFFGPQAMHISQRYLPRFIITKEALIIAKPK